MQLALPIRPAVGARAVEVRRDRDSKLPQPSEERDALPLEARFGAVEGARLVERAGLAVADRQEQLLAAQRGREVDRIVVGPYVDLRQRVSPDRVRILCSEVPEGAE